jgi:dTDP-4-dehydrorhamnose reductase
MATTTSETTGLTAAVVFGAGGMLGQALVAELPALGYRLLATPRGRADGDIADRALVEELLGRLRPAVVFNAAAWTDVDGAEDRTAEARRANAEGPEVLARACGAVGARLVHYSTDFVFDGERETPYDEAVPAQPVSAYGAGKLEGEQRVQAALAESYVVRVGCLYGRGGRNFPSTVLRRLRAGETIRADDERRVSPTWVVPVAQLSARLAATPHFGLYHGTARGDTTWAAFAGFIAEAAGVAGARVEPVSGSALKLKARRPRRAVLVSARLPAVGLSPLPPWQEQARGYIAAEGGDNLGG